MGVERLDQQPQRDATARDHDAPRRGGHRRPARAAAPLGPRGAGVPVRRPRRPEEEALRVRDERRLRALGIARSTGTASPIEPVVVGEAGVPATVEGVPGGWRVDPDAVGRPFEGRTALLSPFDRLVYDRVRAQQLFDFEYQLEMYKPKAARRWGYFALPVLHSDRLVGKLDATADRKRGRFVVHALHEDIHFTPAMADAVHREIEDLARWLGLTVAG
nr:crosslink repair DNA glycosylase YcaQ family protein [Blastococcus sp. PRF04-17]